MAALRTIRAADQAIIAPGPGRALDFSIIAWLIGATCLVPGVAIVTIGNIGVQPIILLLGVYLLLIPILQLRLPLQPLLWMIIVLCAYVVSWALSTAPSSSTLYAVLQGSYLVLGGMAFTAICSTSGHRQAFVRGYLAGALVSSMAAFGQATYSMATGNTIAFANNINFSIVQPNGRGAAFTPEPSVLAMLLIPALLCWWWERQTEGGLLARWQRGWMALFTLGLGLLATKSSSLLYLPALIAAVSVLQCASLRAFAKSMGGILLLTAAAGGVFLQIYSGRLENNDASASEMWRSTKMLAGMAIFESYPVSGAGLGRVSDVDFFSPYMDVPADLSWDEEPRKGIDSTAIRILAETGLIGFAAMYYPILLFFRRARLLFQSAAFGGLGALSYGLLFGQTFISGYRDQLAVLLPMVVFATAGNVLGLAHRSDEYRRNQPNDISLGSGLNQGSIPS